MLLRERVPVLRLAAPLLAVLRGVAVALERLTVERLAVDLRVPLERAVPVPEDFARVERVPVERFAAERVPVAFLRPPLDLRAPLLRDAPEDEPELARAPDPSSDHLPDMTRCAASATASAMIDPNFVALDMTLLAAADAVSAASNPASRILRRAAGLALIAAAAAARPAASISLLIAALASLSTVLLLDLEDDPEEPDDFLDLDELFLADFAIAYSPSVARQDTLRP